MQGDGGAAEDDEPKSPHSPDAGSPAPATTRSSQSRRSFVSSLRSRSSGGTSGITEDQRFHRWCKEGKLNKVSEALNKGGDVDNLLKKRVGVYGYTPLHEAASYGHDEILKVSGKEGSSCDSFELLLSYFRDRTLTDTNRDNTHLTSILR